MGEPSPSTFIVCFAVAPGGMVWEIIEPVNGESIFEDWLKERNGLEGIHHISHDCNGVSWEERMKAFEERGFRCTQSGIWEGAKAAGGVPGPQLILHFSIQRVRLAQSLRLMSLSRSTNFRKRMKNFRSLRRQEQGEAQWWSLALNSASMHYAFITPDIVTRRLFLLLVFTLGPFSHVIISF
jgi:hypothetical protein